jgi:predicted nucleic acid binding AN1-type Zn finger protein
MFEDQDKAKRVIKQFTQAKYELPTMIDCACSRRIPIRFMYKCYYCGEYFCEKCAEVHFGKSRKDYKAEKVKCVPVKTKEKK